IPSMGYNIYNEQKVVMEFSSGLIKENIRHTVDNTIKLVHSSIAILNSKISHDIDASYLNMVKSLAFEIYLVQ
ncbi:hypothetical protein BDF14DRAFT_1710529, partial [Spinellus fusiger]